MSNQLNKIKINIAIKSDLNISIQKTILLKKPKYLNRGYLIKSHN